MKTNTNRQFEIIAREAHTKEGKSFLYYRTVLNSQWYEVKFTKNSDVPQEKGIFHCFIDLRDVNIKIYKPEEQKMPTIWIGKCKLVKLTEDEMFERKRAQLEEAFGTVDVDDTHPF